MREKPVWVYCPVCGGKTRTKVCRQTVVLNFPLYCPKCRKTILVDIAQFKMVIRQEPDT